MSFEVRLLIAISIMICLAAGIIIFIIQYQRRVMMLNRQNQIELMQVSIRSEEEERMRVASELHDDVGATLSSVRLFLHQALLHPDDAALGVQTKELLDQGIRKVRDLSHQLQPTVLEYLGLSEALGALAELITRSGSVRMEMLRESESWPDPDPQTALGIYRIIQELINNISKHANASWIRLSTLMCDGRRCIRLVHDGNGLTEAKYNELLLKKGAIGLKNIQNRLQSASLSLVFSDHEEIPYTIMLFLPN
jgi:two-component system, NarL family, sensor kinase